MPRPHDEGLPFARTLSCEPFATHEGALFPDKRFKFAAVASVEAAFAPDVTAFELALAFPVLIQLARGGGGELRGGEARSGFNKSEREQCQAWGGVEDKKDGAKGDEDADTEGQGTFAVCAFRLLSGLRLGRGDGGTGGDDVRFSVSRSLK